MAYTFVGLFILSVFILIVYFFVKRSHNKQECENCGFRRESHLNKDLQWHPDFELCDFFTPK